MKKIVVCYVVLILPFWIYLANWGASAYRGAAYNLGRAVFWPGVLWPALGQMVGGVIVIGLLLYATLFMRTRR
ncbi:hypothetical protein [Luteimonas huabeiensis]|uniref:hypothetical protein n=1 Tax=Luteimonas huabeiensis TaxID=1244513 RepID=UPI000464A48F|nr:hypothetical protein [Luteimonas huabeiensis]